MIFSHDLSFTCIWNASTRHIYPLESPCSPGRSPLPHWHSAFPEGGFELAETETMNLKSRIARPVLLFVLGIITPLTLSLSKNAKGNTNATSLGAFDVEFDEPVAMRIRSTPHYTIDTDDGDDEWSRMLPPGPAGHLVYVRDSDDEASIRPYTVALFHQLKCLDILRRQYILLLKPDLEHQSESNNNNNGAGDSNAIYPLARRCMEYLRQTTQCHPNLWLEGTKDGRGAADVEYDTVCLDWTQVYDEAAANRKIFDDLFPK